MSELRYMRDETILMYNTSKSKLGYIGYKDFQLRDLFTIGKHMISNWFYNTIHRPKRYVKIWAIDDKEGNYNIYVENYYHN